MELNAEISQEHRFVAEVYRFLAPFVDTTSEIYLSLDGIAAEGGRKQGKFEDARVPDLWFTIIGASAPTLIEAKVAKNDVVTLGQSQLAAWKKSGSGKHIPEAWIAVDKGFKTFFYWDHESFEDILETITSNKDYVQISIPPGRVSFSDVAALALHILRQHNCE